MLILPISRGAKVGRPNVRRGQIAPLLIAAFPALMAAFILATQLASLRHRSVELMIATDAAALAGCNQLIPFGLSGPGSTSGDILLFSQDPIPDAYRDMIFDEVRAAALQYADANQFLTQGVTLDANVTNDPNGEIVIGTQPNPYDVNIDTTLTYTWDLYNPQYNTVLIQCFRGGPIASPFLTGDVAAVVRAYNDRDVTAFKVEGSSQIVQPQGVDPSIPVVPIGILTDYVVPPAGANAASWDYNIIGRMGADSYTIASGTPAVGSDGIPEISVTITGFAADNGQMLDIGSGFNLTTAIGQITAGITYVQLQDPNFNGQLSLAETALANEKTVTRFDTGSFTAVDFMNLAAAFDPLSPATSIIGLQRVWPLFDTVDTPNPGDCHLVGFVSARVMDVQTDNATFVTVVLQPTMFITCTAMTDYSRRTLGPRTIFNPYVSRVRISQ